MGLITRRSGVQIPLPQPRATARANIAIHFSALRYFCCPKENIHFGNICHVVVDSAIHNPLGKPRGFLNRSITAPLPQKVMAALPEKKHSLVLPSVFSPSLACQLFVGARLRRVLSQARSSNSAGYSTSRWTTRQLSRPNKPGRDFCCSVIAPFPRKSTFPSVTTAFAGFHFPSRKICI